MNNKRVGFILAICAIIGLLMGCSKVTPVQTERTLSPSQSPGAFGMSYLKGLGKTRQASSVQSGENVSFNLGSIKGSTAFYFLLYNIGNTPITNVTLSLADTMFSLYPSKIDTLIPGTDIGILPVVKVNAFHGTSFDGVGSRPVMKMGPNSAQFNVQGTTKTKGGTDTAVSLSVGLQVHALLMDFQLSGSCGIVNLEHPPLTTMGRFLSDSGLSVSMPTIWNIYYPANFYFNKNTGTGCYRNDDRDSLITITNTGNVRLSITQFPSGSFPMIQASLSPGDSLNIPNSTGKYIIDGDHTIADPQRMALHTDGKFYFEFDAPTVSTCDQSLDIESFISLARTSNCADLLNRLYKVQNSMVFWAREGRCQNDSFAYTIYLQTPDSIVALYKDSIDGPVEYYVNQEYRNLLTRLRNNIAYPDTLDGVQPLWK